MAQRGSEFSFYRYKGGYAMKWCSRGCFGFTELATPSVSLQYLLTQPDEYEVGSSVLRGILIWALRELFFRTRSKIHGCRGRESLPVKEVGTDHLQA